MGQGQRHEVEQGQVLVLHFRHNHPVLGEVWLENGPSESEYVPRRPRGQMALWFVKEIVWPVESVVIPLYFLLVRLHLESCFEFWVLH